MLNNDKTTLNYENILINFNKYKNLYYSQTKNKKDIFNYLPIFEPLENFLCLTI